MLFHSRPLRCKQGFKDQIRDIEQKVQLPHRIYRAVSNDLPWLSTAEPVQISAKSFYIFHYWDRVLSLGKDVHLLF